jgi:hypothetical protein
MGFAAYGKVTGFQGGFSGSTKRAIRATREVSLAACSASNRLIADSLGHGDQKQEIRDCWGIGSEDAMAQVIEFYVPDRFRKKVRWVPPERRGKVIEFPADVKKSA